jgi:cell division ATPase FtsA
MGEHRLVTGLDVGTTKVCVAIGERTERDVELLGHAIVPTRGIKQGMVVQLEPACASLREAVELAELRAGRSVREVYLSLSEMNTRPEPRSRRRPGRMQSLIQCVERCGLTIEDLVLAPLASAEVLVTEHDKALGVAVVDLGGATTDVAVFAHGELVCTQVLPVGGLHLTSDLAQGLCTPLREAERLKREHGCEFPTVPGASPELLVASLGDQPPHVCTHAELMNIVEARCAEIILCIERVLVHAGCANALGAGVVLCGGTSRMPGLLELTQQLLGVPVRTLHPVGVRGIQGVLDDPAHTAAIGLLLHHPRRPQLQHAAAQLSASAP